MALRCRGPSHNHNRPMTAVTKTLAIWASSPNSVERLTLRRSQGMGKLKAPTQKIRCGPGERKQEEHAMRASEPI